MSGKVDPLSWSFETYHFTIADQIQRSRNNFFYVAVDTSDLAQQPLASIRGVLSNSIFVANTMRRLALAICVAVRDIVLP